MWSFFLEFYEHNKHGAVPSHLEKYFRCTLAKPQSTFRVYHHKMQL